MRESDYQTKVINKLRGMFPDCIILKNDAGYQQGILDFTILHNDRWAALEIKASSTASKQANQEYFVERLDSMSFAAFIYPENEEEVLGALQKAFSSRRRPRVSQS